MSTLKATNLQNASSSSTNLALDTSGNATSAGTVVMSSPYTMRNKIINGAMVIDQRNAGAAVTTTGSYVVDRWFFNNASDATLSVQQSTDVPSGQGFSHSLRMTATVGDGTIGATQYCNLQHRIEGFNFVNFNFGAAGALSVTLSFWVKATVSGNYSVALYNSAENRINPQIFTVNAANTWERKTITYTGDTTGTWLTNNGIGANVTFYPALGSNFLGSAGWNAGGTFGVTGQANAIASNSNIFAITGVQLEAGTVATPFEYRNYQQELAMCMRYYEKTYNQDEIPNKVNPNTANALVGVATSTTNIATNWRFQVNKRTQPTLAFYSWNGTGSGKWANLSNTDFTVSTPWGTGQSGFARLDSTGLTAGAFYWGYATADAEL